MNLTLASERILDALLWRVRVLAFSHVAELVGKDEASRSLRTLSRNGFVESLHIQTKLLQLTGPIFEWAPEDPTQPDFWKLSWAAEARFNNIEAQSHTIYLATEKACRHFGGVGGRLRQPFQLQHDLGTASTFVAYVTRASTDRQGWIGEDCIRRFYRHLKIKKIPDAAAISDDQVAKAIEFAGRTYSGDYIGKFHAFWKKKNTQYEIW